MFAKAAKVVFSIIGAAGVGLLSSLTSASGVILVEPIVTTVNEDILRTRNPRILPPELQPGQAVNYGIPDVPGNYQNGTGQSFVSLVFELETLSYTNPDSTPAFSNEPVQWGDVDGDGKIGFSSDTNLQDYFTNVTITGNVIAFSGGEIPDGAVFFNQFTTTPNLRPGNGIIPPAPPPPADQDGPIRVNGSYRAKAVPEPTSALGLLFLGCLGLSLALQGKHKL